MTDQQILEKVIEKAEKNGLDLCPKFYANNIYTRSLTYQGLHWWDQCESCFVHHETVFDIIFSHDFAKAFWGEELIWTTADEEYMDEAWEVHLQQMVLEKEPLKYLEGFLK